MNQPDLPASIKHSTYALPILVIVQFLLTIGTLGLLAYFKLFSPPVEYPVVIIDPSIEGKYVEKFKGKVTVFDLDDLSEWHYYNDPKATASASHTGVSFIYPPNFDITTDSSGSVHVSQNRKDYLVISQIDEEFSEDNITQPYKLISFGSEKKFYQYQKPAAGENNTNVITIYQGGVNGYGLTVVDTEVFSPEVVYMILMSMTYQG
ncbi:MAG: hypothetical protein NUV98_03095 [Candidatus Roizmanbacteria bacterium]|nr:hypothetical protein [Candidatus Roizmanbacteria bacterium]